MGRRIPEDETLLIHPVLSLSLLAAGMAAAIAIMAGLCGVRSRKKPPPSSPVLSTLTEKVDAFAPPSMLNDERSPAPAAENVDSEDATKDEDAVRLPLPPAMQQKGETSSNQILKSMSERRLSINMSLRVPRSLSVARHRDQKDENSRHNKKGKIKTEDSVWMKTIILGEKCKVPDEESSAVIYEGKGKKISAYHPRTPSSISISRQSSFIDQDAIPSQVGK
ncbi:hypothetical protein FNV43_RR12735 [Rhamnella rubrinervis]|uniref:Uncharacterized protein n=1 Tax=Rhamnella rubrinervis TaxID=2594499 RepID=A0A8K0H8E9_9ROSA|nr:hypothetical protein FNV43_RR12735 [Rhamnella rubrinervis]